MQEPLIKEPKLTSVAPVRPKVLKRPAQFSATANHAEILPITEEVRIDLIQQGDLAPAEPARRPWQEDARFGVALFIAIVVINCLAVWALAVPGALPTQQPLESAIKEPVAVAQPHRSTHPVINVLDDRATGSTE